MRHFLWFLCFLVTSLLADDAAEDNPFDFVSQPEPTSLVNMTAMPSSIVNGSVNVISGDLFESREDYSVSGSDPYSLGHTYSSSGLEEGTLGAGWNFYHHHYLRVYQPEGINFARPKSFFNESSESSSSAPDFSDNDVQFTSEFLSSTAFQTSDSSSNDHFLIQKGVKKNAGGYKVHGTPVNSEKNPFTYLYLREPSGADLLFKGNGWAKNFRLVKKNTGFTNVSGDQISGQTNIKNIKIRWFSESDHWHVVFGDGTRRVYARMKKPKHKRTSYKEYFYDYHLIREVRPSRNTLIFSYDSDDNLKSIETFSHDRSRKHNWIRFEQKKDLCISTSDNQNFIFYRKKNTKSVSGIKRPGLPAIHFSYSGKRMIKRATDDGHYIETAYDSKKRVKSQSAPIGKDGKKVVTHRFSYHDQKKTHYATVKDAHGTITRYHWNRFKRLVKIVKYNSSWKRLMSEQFVWGRTRHTGHLKVRTLFDENNTPLLSRQFSYDNRGNVIREVLYGRFTENSGTIKLDAFGYPTESTCDRIVTERAYSKDGYNLLLQEKDCFGNYTFYKYIPHSNRLKAKFTCEKEAIKKREFFVYNRSAILVQHIVDDGSKKGKENLKDVTERHITRIKPRDTFPHFGKPEVVDQYYLDLDTKKNCLLTRTINSYSDQGFLKEQQLYNSQKNLHAITRFDYDKVGRVTYTEDALGRKEFFKYDHCGRLIEQQGPRSDVTTYYDYDLCSRLIRQTKTQKNGPSFVTRYEYDLLGRKIAIIDPQGNRTKITYDELNRITQIAEARIYDHQGKENIPTQRFEYAKLGTEVTHTDENGFKTKTIFNAIGKVISQQLPDGTTTKNFYDLKGNCIKEIAPNGVQQHIKYDAFSRPTSLTVKREDKVLSQKKMGYNTFHLILEVGPTNETVHHSYDYAGRKKATKLGNRETSYRYNEIGLLHTETSHGVTKEFSYDVLNRCILESVKNGFGKQCSFTVFGYDVDGNCCETTSSIMGELAANYTNYDPHGRVIEQIDAKGNSWKYTYDDFATNAHHQTVIKKTSLHPTGISEEELFDSHGRLSHFTRYDPFGLLLAEKELFYDSAGNCIRVCEHSIVNGITQKTISTLFFCGPNNRLECLIEAYNTPEEKTTKYSHNNLGQKEQTIHADGSILQHIYDHRGRLKRFFGNAVDYHYEYDASDRITRVFNAITEQQTLRTYDDIGNLTSETLESGFTTDYAYDQLGRVKEMTLPDLTKIAYTYSPVFLESIKRLTADDQEKWQHLILERDLSGNILSTQASGEVGKIFFEYDSLNRQTKIAHNAFTEELLQFDPAGNLLALKFTDATGSHHNTYLYNDLYQLTEETGHTPNTYAYDSLHNRIDHQVNALHSVLHDGKKSFTYDARGNRTKMGETAYQYDALDRLIEVSTPTQKTTYSYDAFDRRLEKKQFVLSETEWTLQNHERYLYSQQNEIGCVDSLGIISQLRVLGEGLGAEIGAAVAIELDDFPYIPIHDHRGNVVALIEPQGSVIESYRYDAYGNEEIFSHVDSGNPWRFSSKRVDPETGLIYFGRRYYDPSIGKWLTQDPLGVNAGPNLYAYVLNNPMTMVDLYGLLEQEHRSLEYSTKVNYVTDRNGNHVVDRNDNPITRHPRFNDHTLQGKSVSSEELSAGISSWVQSSWQKYGENLIIDGRITNVNGVLNTRIEAKSHLKYVSDIAGGSEVDGLHNATHGLAVDSLECVFQTKLHGYSAPTRMLRDDMKSFYAKNPDVVRLLISFSQGAAVVKGALELVSYNIQQKIISVAFGPAAIIPSALCLESYNYISTGDIIPWIADPTGIALNRDCVYFVNRHPNARSFPLDHAFQSPTYRKPLKKHIREYINTYGNKATL